MGVISVDPRHNLHLRNTTTTHQQQSPHIIEEIEGLIRVYKDERIERPPIIPNVPCTHSSQAGNVISRDVIIHKDTNLWARVYLPSNTNTNNHKLPLLLYFHGGGFCVGSASWSCYHEFLAHLCSRSRSVILSVNYRLAPESRLPAAYEDGFKALMWVKNEANGQKWWLGQYCNLSCLFLGGDSAGANIAYNLLTKLGSESTNLSPLSLKGVILIQPFFGGEVLTASERYSSSNQAPNSALTLHASDTYWRLCLPLGANKDHPYCNPLARGAPYKLRAAAIMVCVSEVDILKDRNLELCDALVKIGCKVETKTYKGVGHAFQVLHNSPVAEARAQEMMSHIKAFLHRS